MEEIELSVVVPVFNEEEVLVPNTTFLGGHLDRIVGAGRWQFVIVDNGSKDRTPELAREVESNYPTTTVCTLPKANIGEALRVGLMESAGRWAAIINVEQWDLPFMEWSWKLREEHDLFVGSKRADATLNRQSDLRYVLSWGLYSRLRLLVGSTTTDTHGPKLLDREALAGVLDDCVMRRGQYDTELTLRAVRYGLRVAEAPVRYEEQRPPRNFMVRKIAQNVYDLGRLRRAMADAPWPEDGLRVRRYTRRDVLEGCSVAEEETFM